METIPYLERLALCIDGHWHDASSRSTSEVVNPATGQVIGQLPVATEIDIDNAIAASEAAFGSWSGRSAWERDAILRRAAALIDSRRDRIAALLTLENGKPLADSQGELDRVLETLLFCAEEGKRAYGRVMPPRSPDLEQISVKRAIGPVGAFVPWNFPAVLAIRKVAAALAAGCTVVLKPAEECPAVCIELVRALHEAGVPGGALNLLFGEPARISERVIAAPQIRKISFTGSTQVGRLLAEQAGRHLKPVTMELGGHAPVVVFDDVDPERVAAACVGFKFRNAGQVCLSPSRFYVQEGIYEAFTEAFVERARALRVGDPFEHSTQMGPLNNPRRLEAAVGLVAEARSRGARVQLGGERIGDRGYFFAPTVLTDVSEDAQLMREEPFCPVAPIASFQSMDEVMALANDRDVGLAAYAFTNRLDRAHQFAEQIEAGWVGINNFTPALADAAISGMKASGLGHEGGPEGLDAYLQTKFLSQSNRLV